MLDDLPRTVAGLVLAAGTSTRMGQNKLLLDFGGETLVHRVGRTAWEAGLDPVIVVLGHEAELVAGEIHDLPCLRVLNPDYAQGIQTSLRAGLAAVPASAAAAVVVLADMPLVDAGMIATLLRRYAATGASLIVSRYDGVNAPPTLYDRSLFAELIAMRGEGCGKQVVNRHRDDALAVDWPAATLTDLDVPEDVERLRALVGVGQQGRRRAV
jgi:molybdenum cofactor cytidylyltransferase